jgi:hypothetical protein
LLVATGLAACHVVDCLAEGLGGGLSHARHRQPTAAEREKGRRRLDRFVNTGHLIALDPGDRKTNAYTFTHLHVTPPEDLHDRSRTPTANAHQTFTQVFYAS